MKKIIFVLLFCPFFMGLTQIRDGYNSFKEVSMEFENLYQNAQDKKVRVTNIQPTKTTLFNREMVIYSTTTGVQLYFNIDGTTWSVKLSSE